MSPLKPVVITTRRGLVVAALVAALALPTATYLAGARVNETADATAQIQAERTRNTLNGCVDQNERHDRAVRVLNEILGAARREASAEKIRRSRETTTRLIDALAPRKDCEALVKRLIDTK